MREVPRRSRIASIASALLLLIVAWLAFASSGVRAGDPVVWREHDAVGHVRVHLYFFRTASCPHCQDARPIVERLAEEHAWLVLHDYELSSQPDAGELYVQIAKSLGEEARAVPGFAFCGQIVQGWPGEAALD
jgi:thiol-disulfide isomerase/thioredoxin